MSKIFPTGIRFWTPRDGAPEFVLGTVEITDIDELVAFAKSQGVAKMRLDVKRGQSGKVYLELNTYQGKPTNVAYNPVNVEIAKGAAEVRQKATVYQANDTDLPF